MKSLIAIGDLAGPGVVQNTDRWAQPTDSWGARECFWIAPEAWEKVKWFETPIDEKQYSTPEVQEILSNPRHPVHQDIHDRVAWAKYSTLKQMNLPGADGELRRTCFVLGARTHRPWTWYERVILYPLSKLNARRLNRGCH